MCNVMVVFDDMFMDYQKHLKITNRGMVFFLEIPSHIHGVLHTFGSLFVPASQLVGWSPFSYWVGQLRPSLL